MGKAVLVINLPEICMVCPCYDDYWMCNLCPDEELTQKEIYEKRADWCPLKPLPEKIETDLKIRYEDQKNEPYYEVGWNACIDAITGETE